MVAYGVSAPSTLDLLEERNDLRRQVAELQARVETLRHLLKSASLARAKESA
jgi:uncharacterized protein YlxW (UPF0749 family)